MPKKETVLTPQPSRVYVGNFTLDCTLRVRGNEMDVSGSTVCTPLNQLVTFCKIIRRTDFVDGRLGVQ